MPKKIICAILPIALLLSGCAGIVDGEYSSSVEHETVTSVRYETAERTVEAANREELDSAIFSFVEDRIEYGKVKFTAYDGDVSADLSGACMHIANDTPLGAYAVYYISYNLNMIVSHYEADISITYKRTAEELSAIAEVEDIDALDEMLLDAMENHEFTVTLYDNDGSITPAVIMSELEELYFAYPEKLIYLPEAEVSAYPEASSPSIIEVSFAYPYSKTVTENRIETVRQSIETYLALCDGRSGDDAIRILARAMADNVSADTDREMREDYSKWYNIYTAYGAFVLNRAAGEGYALAMKILCDRLGIECLVVRGRLNNVSHSWNIVRLEDGNYYHFDVSMLGYENETETESAAVTGASDTEAENDIFYTDSEMSGSYWWDSQLYPVCDGPSLQPEPENQPAEPPVTAPGTATVPAQPNENENENEGGETPSEPPVDAENPDPGDGEEPTEPGEGEGGGEDPEPGSQEPPSTEEDPPSGGDGEEETP